jgi:hypothetical protein
MLTVGFFDVITYSKTTPSANNALKIRLKEGM